MDSDPEIRSLDQVVYTIMRMKRPADLLRTFVFDPQDLTVAKDMPEPESTEQSGLPADDLQPEVIKFESLEVDGLMDDLRHPPSVEAVGLMAGVYSCACKPSKPASSVPVLVSAAPSNCIPSASGVPLLASLTPSAEIADLDAEIAATEAKLYSLKQQKLAELQGEIASLESKGAASSTILGEQGSVPSQEVFQM